MAPLSLCTDNAGMIASLAYHKAKAAFAVNQLGLDIAPNLKL